MTVSWYDTFINILRPTKDFSKAVFAFELDYSTDLGTEAIDIVNATASTTAVTAQLLDWTAAS